jgi:hypothetical protein
MTDEQIALARRAVAFRGWRWMRGMAVRPVLEDGSVEDVTGVVVQFMGALPVVWWPDLNSRLIHTSQDHLLPDLTDPATMGCLLALVREAWDQKHITPQMTSKKWLLIYQGFGTPNRFFYGTSEVDVMVAALEAAPCGR